MATRRIAAAARRLLDASVLCAISTVSPRGQAHINTAYFATDPAFDIVWLSEPKARHSLNIRSNGSVAIAVYDSHQTWGRPDRGIQLFGSARQLNGQDARQAGRTYARRFPEYGETDFASYRLYRFRPRRMKLFDEASFGAGVFVIARVERDGRLTWERTEIYRASD